MSAPQSTPSLAKPGDLIAGKYRVEREIARGGMGVVMAALHEGLDQRVAIKFLLPAAMESPEAVGRFEREARASAKLHSDHVTRVFDVGTLPNGAGYMVMEYLEGADLAGELAARGPLPVEETVDAVLQALEAIAEAHAAGIIHRDLKPSNLFRAKRPDGTKRIKVLDFGISKITTGGASAAITSTSTLLGSPGYMSPEQVRSSKNVDVRTDVWSLGTILYELLSGRMLFDGENVGEVFAKILEEDVPSLVTIRSDVLPELDRVILRCLERDREKRFADATELRNALLPFASDRQRMSIVGSLSGDARRASHVPLATAATIQAVSTPLPPRSEIAAQPEATLESAKASSTQAEWSSPRTTGASTRRTFSVAALGVVAIGIVSAAIVWSRRGDAPDVERTPAANGAVISAAPMATAVSVAIDVTPAPSAPTAVTAVTPAPAISSPSIASASATQAGAHARSPKTPGAPSKVGLPNALQGRD